jgi:hypothetical protein
MKERGWRVFFGIVLIAFVGIGLMAGCESGEKAVDEVTGNRAVKQYRKMEKDVERLETQQAERYKSILGEEEEKDSDQ